MDVATLAFGQEERPPVMFTGPDESLFPRSSQSPAGSVAERFGFDLQ
jgi:hypothetical protein